MWIVVFNISASVGIVLLSKVLFSYWPYPMMTTAVHLAMTWVYVSKRTSTKIDTAIIAHKLMAILLASSVALTNMSLQLNSIGIYELVKSAQLPLTLCLQWCYFRVHEGKYQCALAVTVALLVASGAAPVDGGRSGWMGLLAALGGVCANCSSKLLIKAYRMAFQIDSDALLASIAPIASALLTVVSMLVEKPDTPPPATAAVLLLTGLLAVCINYTTFRVISEHSPAYYLTLGPIKTIVVVAIAASWGDIRQSVSIVGAAAFSALYVYVQTDYWANAPVRDMGPLVKRQPGTAAAAALVVVMYVAGVQLATPPATSMVRRRDASLFKPGVLKEVTFGVVTTVVAPRVREDRTDTTPRHEGSWLNEVRQLPNTFVYANMVGASNTTLDAWARLPGINATRAHNYGRQLGECPGYLRYLYEHYDALPDVSVFLHGYPYDHNPDIIRDLTTFIDRVAEYSTLPAMDYVHLNTYAIRDRCLPIMGGILSHMFSNSSHPGCLAPTYCCAQFMVTREAIRRIHRDVYRKTLEVAIEKGTGCGELEHSWHMLFRGEMQFTGLTIGELIHSVPSEPAPEY